MRIGIDAKWFFEGPPSGKVVIRNLVEKLVEVNKDHKLIFFIDQKRKNEFTFQAENVESYGVWNGNNLISNLFFLPLNARKAKVDILIYQNFTSFLTPYKQVAYIHDIIFLTHPQFYSLRERLYFSPLKMLAKKSDYVCTVSFAEKKRIMEYYNIKENKIDFVHHGANPVFKPKKFFDSLYLKKVKVKYKLPDDYLLYVGRLNVRKNVFNLFEGFALSKHRKSKLVIVGGYDWKMKDVQKTVSKLKLENDLLFTGPVYSDELAAIYAMSKLFCFPSYEESFGLPPLEAMSCGVPVIVSNSSSLPEICGEAGTFVNANDPSDIAAKINLLMTDQKLYREKTSQSLEQATKFSWEASAKELIKMCEKVMTL